MTPIVPTIAEPKPVTALNLLFNCSDKPILFPSKLYILEFALSFSPAVVIPLFILAVTFICFLLYAPADTKKRPLVRKNRRIKFKLLTITVAVIYILLYFYTNSMFLKNVIMCSMLLEAVLIHPLTYRVFKLPYNNYEGYVFSK